MGYTEVGGDSSPANEQEVGEMSIKKTSVAEGVLKAAREEEEEELAKRKALAGLADLFARSSHSEEEPKVEGKN